MATQVAVAQEAPIHPVDVAVGSDGTVFVADRQLPGIWQWKEGAWSIYFRGEKKIGSTLNAVRCLAIDSDGKLLAGDSSTFNIYRFDDAAKPTALSSGRIGIPMGIAVNSAGDVFVSDLELQRIYKLAAAKEGPVKPEVFATIAAPRGLAVDSKNQLWVVSGTKDQLRKVAPDGSVEVAVAGTPMKYPSDVAVNSKDEVFVVDSYQQKVFRVNDGELQGAVGEKPLQNPVGITFANDTLHIVDSRTKAVFVVKEGVLHPLGE